MKLFFYTNDFIYQNDKNDKNLKSYPILQVTLFLRNNMHGSKEIELPIDKTVSDLKIKFNGNVETATLATPSGG